MQPPKDPLLLQNKAQKSREHKYVRDLETSVSINIKLGRGLIKLHSRHIHQKNAQWTKSKLFVTL